LTVTKTESSATQTAGRVLVVDDDANLLQTFQIALEAAGYRVALAATAAEAESQCARNVFEVCLLDVSLGYDSGIELLPRLLQYAPQLRVVMVSAESDIDTAFKAFAAGAVDYLVKPCSPEQLQIAVARQFETRRLAARVESLEREVQRPGDDDLQSESPAMRRALDLAHQVADTDANVLILGESGSGKGVLAQALHRWSARRDADLITVNCPSLSSELLESELFGHNKGAFTGAVQSNAGRVAQAEGGTLFLDEIGDFPLALQPKLLRFIQDQEYERIGDPVTRHADVRLVAATNHDLEAMSRDGRFRQDLFYRLNVISILLPPLRERRADIPQIARRLLQRFAKSYRRPARDFSEGALSRLQDHHWPGNVRELQNAVERAVILCQQDVVETEHLAIPGESETPSMQQLVGSDVSLEELERMHLTEVLQRSDTLEAAARVLGIDASTLYRKRKAFGLT
jgi:NtrC-family two-component system response regulator AlgB